jgi:nitrite reductase/ring-hydroxylating ferredoxin subunit/uncharacterized membrane protein
MNPEITSTRRLIDRLSAHPALGEIAEVLQPPLRDLLEGDGPVKRQVNDLLHGSWIGHSIHPMVTDIPIGAWTVGAVCDTLVLAGRASFADTAFTATTIGAFGAVAAAVTGIAEWSDTKDEPQRLGMLHWIANSAALTTYLLSIGARAAKKPKLGAVLGLLGFGMVSAGAYLGGELSLGMQLGGKHTTIPIEPPIDFERLCDAEEIADGATKALTFAGIPVLVTNSGGAFSAVVAVCTHRGAPLSDVPPEDGCVTCPWHGSRFALADGAVKAGPATFALAQFETRVDDGVLELRVMQP